MRCFRNWRKRAQASHVGRAAVSKLQHKTMHMAFASWKRESESKKQEENILRQTLQAMTGLKLRQVWSEWRLVAGKKTQLKTQFVNCIKIMQNRQLNAAWSSWKSQHEEACWRKYILMTTLGRIHEQNNAHIFQSWHQVAVRNKNLKAAVAKVLAGKSLNLAQQALRAWTMFTAVRRQQASKMQV